MTQKENTPLPGTWGNGAESNTPADRNTTVYTPGMAVMVMESALSQEWHIGIVTKPTDTRFGWTRVDVKNSPNSRADMLPGWPADRIRLATPEDLTSLPDWAKDWFDAEMLDRRDPRVPARSSVIAAALRAAGIRRLSDLQSVTDDQLLALRGVGKKAVLQLREWQAKQVEGV